MTRLTKQTRENMVADLLRRKFEEPGAALMQRSIELFKLIYEDHYDATTRGHMAKIKARYRDGFEHYSRIDCKGPGGMRISVGATRFGADGIFFIPKVEPLPFLADHRADWPYIECEIGQQLADFAALQAGLIKDIQAARREALGALSTVTTAKQLTELWPEAMPILAKHIPVPSGSNLPAVQFAKLTESFGLSAGGANG